MKFISKFSKYILFLLGTIFILYLSIPSPLFPNPPPDSLISTEPGDTRKSNIRAYYTDLDREEIILFYQSQMERSSFSNIPLLTVRLKDYPPEEAPQRIMDELKSSYLEELVNPLRESVFVSVWEPTDPRFALIVNGIRFQNKITIRYYNSFAYLRVLIGVGILIIVFIIFNSTATLFKKK